MRRTFQVLLLPLVIVLGMAVAPPANAMVYTSSITFNASPEPLAAGANVTLSGTAGYKTSGNAATVRFYFRKYNAATFTLITSTTAATSGKFSKQTKQSTSGQWKAVYAGNSIRKPVTSGVDYVEAKAWRNVASTRFSHAGTGEYTGPPVTWYTDRPAKVSVQVDCSESSPFNFLDVFWNGHPGEGFDYASFEFTGTSTSGSGFIYPDQSGGYIEVATQFDCSWTVSITQIVRSYVKV
jgi:hypothetical protein